jgi:ribonuclease HI
MKECGVTVLSNLVGVVVWGGEKGDIIDTMVFSANDTDDASTSILRAVERVWEKYSPQDIHIHLDNLHAYNVITRYLESWNRQSWYTSKNIPVPNRDLMMKLFRQRGEGCHVTVTRKEQDHFSCDSYIETVKGVLLQVLSSRQQ